MIINNVVDPDPCLDLDWIRIQWDPKRAKMAQKNRKQLINFIFRSDGCSFLRTEDFSSSLGVLYGGLGISKLQFMI
jgi:hypothetical protein